MMKHLISWSLLLLLTGVVPAFAGWSDAEAEDIFERTVALAAGSEVVVENANGGIEVESWDRDEVRIWAKKKARARDEADAQHLLDEIEIRIEERPGWLMISTKTPRVVGRGRSASVSYEITVPRSVKLEASSTNGGLAVEGIAGRVVLETVNGGIKVSDIAGDLEARTTNGGIKARGLRGLLNASTTNGGIDAEILSSDLREDISLTTTNGSIEVALSRDLAASVTARSQNGRVETDFPITVQGEISKRRLEFDLNGGGPKIELRTSNGRIRLREL